MNLWNNRCADGPVCCNECGRELVWASGGGYYCPVCDFNEYVRTELLDEELGDEGEKT